MRNLMDYTLFSWGPISVNPVNLTGIVLVLLLSSVVLFFVKRLLAYRVRKQAIKAALKKKVSRLLKLTLLLVDVLLILRILGVQLQDMMQYTLLDIDPVYITPFHLFLIAFAIIAIQFMVLAIRKMFDRMIASKSMEIGIGSAVYQIFKYIIWVIAIILILDSVGVKITLLLAGTGALLIGIGFGVQQIFSDVISGFILLFERNLKVQDVVEVDGIVGRVLSIGLRTTRIITRDNIEMLIPNTKFIKDNIVNWSHMEKATRFRVRVHVAYGSDVEKVRDLLLSCAATHPDVLEDPEPIVFFKDFGDHSLDFEVYFWTHRSFRFERIRSDIRFAIDKAFREHNVHIPFPQRDIHMRTK